VAAWRWSISDVVILLMVDAFLYVLACMDNRAAGRRALDSAFSTLVWNGVTAIVRFRQNIARNGRYCYLKITELT
jgi:hypothetical protein